MPNLVTDSNGIPAPQYLGRDGLSFANSKGANGGFDVNLISEIPTGSNVIGAVSIVTLPSIPAGANNIGTVNSIDAAALSAVNSAGTGTVVTGTPNDTTTFADLTNSVAKGVQVYVASTAAIVAIIIEVKIGSVYYPLLVSVPNTILVAALAHTAIFSPRFNGMLPGTWRIRVVTATASTPTITASYQYIV